MKKNVIKTVRVNDQVLKLLEREGYTIQKLVDEAIAKKIKVETTVTMKGRK